MGEWHEVKRVLYGNHPCTHCEMGWGSIAQKTIDGKLYEKHDDCHEDCERLKDYIREHMD